MKGDLFNILEAFIIDNWGIEQFEEIYELTLPTLITKEPFVGPGTYPDSDFLALVGKTLEKLSLPADQTIRSFGKYAFPKLAAKMPKQIETFKDPKELLKNLDSIVHVEVKKLLKDASPPKFTCTEIGKDKLLMVYESPRRMYDLVDGLLDGVADHYKVKIDSQRCIINRNGFETCEFELTFSI